MVQGPSLAHRLSCSLVCIPAEVPSCTFEAERCPCPLCPRVKLLSHLVVAFPRLHISRLESVTGVLVVCHVSSRVELPAAPASFISPLLPLLPPSIPLRPGCVSCLIAQNRLWGSLPEVGTLAGPWQLLLPSETARNQRLISGLNLGSSSLQTPCLQGGGSAVWGSPRDSHFSESLTRTRS